MSNDITIRNKRRIRRRNEEKKRAAIAKVGADTIPGYRRKKRIRKKTRKALRRAEIAAFNAEISP